MRPGPTKPGHTAFPSGCYGLAQQGMSSVMVGAVVADAVAADENSRRTIAPMASAVLILAMTIVPLWIP